MDYLEKVLPSHVPLCFFEVSKCFSNSDNILKIIAAYIVNSKDN